MPYIGARKLGNPRQVHMGQTESSGRPGPRKRWEDPVLAGRLKTFWLEKEGEMFG